MSNVNRVTIVGAGLVGPVLAILLARRGVAVTLLEARPDPTVVPPPPGKSNHLVLNVRGWKALRQAGVEPEVRRFAIPLEGRQIHNADGSLGFYPYGNNGQHIFAINRSHLNLVVTRAARAEPGIDYRFNHRCLSYDAAAHTVELERVDTGERLSHKAEVIIDAEGAFSRIRYSLIRTDRFDYQQSYLSYGHKEISIRPSAELPLVSSRMHVWPRKRTMLTAFPNPDGTFSATLLLPFEGEPSFAAIHDEEELRAFFRRTYADALPLATNLADDYFNHPTVSLITTRCFPWVINGRLALIGDAAHSMVPFLGQGMNSGLEDCTVLCTLLEEHGRDWPRALEAYQAARKPNADAVTEMSARNFVELSELVGDQRFMLQKQLERKTNSLYPNRFIPMYQMVAFTHIPYAEVYRRSRVQEALAQGLLQLPNVADRLDSPELEAEIHRRMAACDELGPLSDEDAGIVLAG